MQRKEVTSYTRRLADFASKIRLEDIPQEAITRAKWLILDAMGCALYGCNAKSTQILARTVARLEPGGGTASIWGRHETASAPSAALVNGSMIQAFELDDGHPRGGIHSCAVVLPPALAAAQVVGIHSITAERFLSAIVAGFEVGPRVGMCMDPARMVSKGWHAPAVVASFPAAVTAGIILGLNQEQMFQALGIAGTQASGLMAVQYGSMMKRMQSSKNAQAGLYAALLAAEGFTGIEDIFEQEFGGYCSTFTQSTEQFELNALIDGLGRRWETMGIAIKVYACAGGNQSAVNAIEQLVDETGLKADHVDEVVVAVTEAEMLHHGWSPYVPKSLTTAQMHLGFCVAMQLIEGQVFIDQMIEANIARPDLVELANRVKIVRSVAREGKGPAYRKGADVVVQLKDGRRLARSVDFRPGNERRPLTDAQMLGKFRLLAGKVRPADHIARMERAVWNLNGTKGIEELSQLLQ